MKVRLERVFLMLIEEEDHNFNSMKVRLEQFRTQFLQRTLQFQFHEGTIGTLPAFRLSRPQHDFNSMKVRLERCRAGDA